MNALDLLKQMVSFLCLSMEEKPIADFLEKYCISIGFQTFRKADNVWVVWGDGEEVLLLNSHLDVVPPSQGHPFAPHIATESDGKLFGRGTVDAKASGVAMLWALKSLKEEGWKPKNGKVIVALTAAEENSKIYSGIADIRSEIPRIDAAIVGEPTEMMPCTSQKGLLILNLHAKGKSAHAARGHLGINAIEIAARDVLTLSDFRFERPDAFGQLPSLHCTVIQGGTVHNVIPDECTVKVDIRSTAAYNHQEITKMMQAVVTAQVEVHSERIIPVATAHSEKIVQTSIKTFPNRLPFASPTTSDWIFLSDIPTVKMGIGRSELSHTAEEHIVISDFEQGILDYKSLIKNYYDLNFSSK